MPFLVTPFVRKLQTKLDKEASNFISMAASIEETAEVWSAATGLGAAGIIPANGMIAPAQMAMKSVILTTTPGGVPHETLKDAFVTFQRTMCPGFLVPLAVGIPASSPPAIESCDPIGMPGPTVSPWLMCVGNLVQTWFLSHMLTYTAVPPIPGVWL